jgi:hypothetical protein
VLTNVGAVASSGAAKGRLLYQRRLSVIFNRCPRVQGSHGGLTPPALVLLRERLSAKKRFLRTLVTCGDKSGGRQPAVGVGNALATALPLTHGRPPRVRVPIAGAVALIVTTGADAPRSCVARMHVCWGFTISGAGALANHGGLTPPLLVCTRVCASGKSLFCRHRTAWFCQTCAASSPNRVRFWFIRSPAPAPAHPRCAFTQASGL